jgi:hypothetical protein
MCYSTLRRARVGFGLGVLSQLEKAATVAGPFGSHAAPGAFDHGSFGGHVLRGVKEFHNRAGKRAKEKTDKKKARVSRSPPNKIWPLVRSSRSIERIPTLPRTAV